MKLEDKVALVTGGARGIGAAIASAYLSEGAKVVVADRDLDALTPELEGRVTALEVDVAQQPSIDAMVKRITATHGHVDVLVNNAAVFEMAPILEITRESYDRVFDINVKGLLFTLQAVAAAMVRNGNGGKIINMSSQAGQRGEALVAVYCASKAAVISLTQSAGLDLIRYGINVNGISPGVVDTPMWDQVDALFAKYENRPVGEKKRLVGEQVPFGRMGIPDDHAGAAVFLASADSDYVVGQTLAVNGGNWVA